MYSCFRYRSFASDKLILNARIYALNGIITKKHEMPLTDDFLALLMRRTLLDRLLALVQIEVFALWSKHLVKKVARTHLALCTGSFKEIHQTPMKPTLLEISVGLQIHQNQIWIATEFLKETYSVHAQPFRIVQCHETSGFDMKCKFSILKTLETLRIKKVLSPSIIR